MKQVFYVQLEDGAALDAQVAAMGKLIARMNLQGVVSPGDFVAVKVHVGEGKNTTHVKPELVRAVVDSARGKNAYVFLTETSTLYSGERHNAVKHILHAYKHGFSIEKTGAPFIMADGLTGNSEVEVEIDGELEQTVKIAREIVLCDVLIAVSHPTGHMVAGLGACLKNLGMGLASRAGKLRQHSTILPVIAPDECRLCKKCIKWCPAGAIIEQGSSSRIIPEKCLGCGECLTVCRYGAVRSNWGADAELLQKRMVEYARGVVDGKEGKCLYFNVLVDMTKECDCVGERQKKLLPDLGILASYDPVAIDQATLDLTKKAGGATLGRLAHPEINPEIQLRHAVKMGLGVREYELVRI